MKIQWWHVAIGLAVGGLLLERHDAAIRAESALLATQDSLSAAREQANNAERRRLEADKESKRLIAEAQERIDWASLRRDSLKAAQAVAIAELRAVVPPAQRIFVDNLERNQKALQATCDSMLADMLVQCEECRRAWQRADENATLWKALSEKWEGQSAAWEKRARPGILEQARRGLPWIALGLLAGFLLAK